MKNLFLPALLFLLAPFSYLHAQKKSGAASPERCGTMPALEKWQQLNQTLSRQNSSAVAAWLTGAGRAGQAARLQAVVTIPVVFHIVLPNPFVITDADCQAQIDRLNLDYSGQNADSTNIPAAFQTVRGHSQIRFVLAKRTPAGQPTSGVERRASATTYDGSTDDPIKSLALGGMDAWDYTQYMNVWVGGGGGILGYATFPGTSPGSQQGIVTDKIGTGTNACYVDPSYNLGRTLTHETGHYLGLYHIWGDETACTNSDFRNLAGTCIITDTLLAGGLTDQAVGDTPNQDNENFGCPSGTLTNGCGSTAGDMYQNFMDYTNDACMTMFTAKQAARMEWVISNCRSGYLTTLGGLPPASAITWDAAPSGSVSPGGFEVIGCATVAYPDALSCPGTVTPKVRIQNRGLGIITTLTVGYTLNNGAPITQTVAVTLAPGAIYVVSFPTISTPVGNYTFKFFTSQPNGAADQVTANDTLTQLFRVLAPTTPPVMEGFESGFPFANFMIDNPDGDVTWARTTPGRNGSAGKLSFDNYNTDTRGTFDDFRSAAITVDPSKSYVLSFDVAHKYYNQSGYHDTLSVLVSNNCGQTFTRIFQQWGPTLAGAAGTFSLPYTTPAEADWRTEQVTIPNSLFANGQLIIAFRNSGRYGNFIHLENINLAAGGDRDLQLVSINGLNNFVCTPSVTPAITVRNLGSETITGFRVGYSIDGGTVQTTAVTGLLLPQSAQTTVSLPAISTNSPGEHLLRVYTFQPTTVSGSGDARTLNDTLVRRYSVLGTVSAPLVENFAGTTFPPANWGVANPDNSVGWSRSSLGNGNPGSAFLNSFAYPADREKDDLSTPIINFGAPDSVRLSFDLAAAAFVYPNQTIGLDTLEVLLTKDCGSSFTTIYRKWGVDLQTLNNPGFPTTTQFFPTAAAQWRRESIDLTSFAGQSPLQIVFRLINNSENNVFMDNVNFATQTLPSQLKQNGYLILPTAFQAGFRVWHYQDPQNLRSVGVFNSAGQLVWSKQFGGNADRQMWIDLNGKAAGIYFVRLWYGNGTKSVVERVLKY